MSSRNVKVPLGQLGFAESDASVVGSVAVELATRARALVREEGLAGVEVSVGKVFSNAHQSECGVFLQNGLRIGAAAKVRGIPGAPFIEVRVAPLAKVELWLVWGSLAVSLALGFFVGMTMLSTEPGVRLALGLLGGVALGIVAITLITRLGIGREKEASEKLAVALERLVTTWSSEKNAHVPV